MNRRFFIMLCIALLLALFAAWIANHWIQGKVASSKEVSVPVVVAAAEVPYGTKLDETQVKVIFWPDKLAPQGSFSKKEDVINSVTLNKFYPDEIITEKRISKNLGGSTLSATIDKNYRALSVRVDDVVGVAGFILPGNNVDVLATKMDRTLSQAVTRTLLQNIKVLAVDQVASQENEKPAIVRAVTLQVTPEQAELVVKAMQEGTLQLTLRNPLDSVVEVKPAKPVESLTAPPVQTIVQPKLVEKTPKKKRVLIVIPWDRT